MEGECEPLRVKADGCRQILDVFPGARHGLLPLETRLDDCRSNVDASRGMDYFRSNVGAHLPLDYFRSNSKNYCKSPRAAGAAHEP